MGVGDFSSGSPFYLGHFKSSSANNAYVLIEADDDPRIAGVLFKTEDTDNDVRIKGALFFDNSGGDSFGRGILKLAINSAASNTNVTVSDVLLGISTTEITAYTNINLNNNDLDGGGSGRIVNIDTIDCVTLNASEKNFDIEHPTKGSPWRLQYTSLEGPEAGVYLRGETTDNVIEFPDYWTGLVHEDSITVQLTPKGSPCVHYVEKIEDNKVYINCQDGQPNCYYLIQAKRKDVNGPKLEYIKE